MRRILTGSLLLTTVLLAQSLQAEVCEIEITRKACSGFESESYKKCQGKQTCTKQFEFLHPRECEKKAYQSCLNSRLSITHSKVIRAKFQGKFLKDGENFCEPDRYDFNSCDKK